MNKYASKYLVYYPSTVLKGEFVFAYLSRYKRFQYFSHNQIHNYGLCHLKSILKYASKYSNYYHNRIKNDGYVKEGFDDFIEVLQGVPYLSKKELIANISDISTIYSKWSSTKTTGGSTGEPVTILKNPSALARERAATWRCYEWAGVGIGDKQARFWGIPHDGREKVKAMLIDSIANRRRISAFNLTDDSLSEYYSILSKYKPDYLYGYVSVIEEFGRYIDEKRLDVLPSLKAIITTSEVLSESSRSRIQNVFGVRVYNEYGCGEVGSIAHECEYGNMHIVADNLYVEIDGVGGSGEIVVTDYFNKATPLIRYKIGDFASIDYGSCDCGRKLPMLKGIHGRAYDIVHTSNGRAMHPEAVMYIFEDIQKKSQSFKQFQVIQEDLSTFTINLVPTKNWSEEMIEQIKNNIREHISNDINPVINLVENIQRENSGKMRVIKSKVSV